MRLLFFRFLSVCSSLLLAMMLAWPAQASSYVERPEVQVFIDDVSERHGLDRAWVSSVLAEARVRESVVTAMSRPAERVMTWRDYRKLFVNDRRINLGREFLAAHATTLARAESVYGVPPEMIAAILGVETYYGRNTGTHRVLDALANLGFDYAPRAEFFRKELEQFLLLVREQQLPVAEVKGSYAGAMGWGQFIPSSYRHYATDFNEDGRIDLWNVEDAIGSVARYFQMHGWQAGQPVAFPLQADADAQELERNLQPGLTLEQVQAAGYRLQASLEADTPVALIRLPNGELEAPEYWLGLQNFYVITRYNRSPMYAMAVYHLSRALRHAP